MQKKKSWYIVTVLRVCRMPKREGICDLKKKPLKNGFPLSSLPPSLWISLGACISMLGNHCLDKLALMSML